MPDFSRRSIILGTAGVAAAGAGVTAAASGLSGSVEGQADVQAEQALTVTDVSVVNSGGSSDVDASFVRTSDDNTEFQAAVELNNGDLAAFAASIENSAADNLDVQVTVDSPDAIDVDVVNTGEDNVSGQTPDDLDPDGGNGDGNAVQTGEGTYIAEISGTQDIGIIAELDDTADPGSYDIGVAINPLSTDG
ncbi:MAG: hypothetical protein J07HQW1_00904 [Haloquadratum walsbyi J07HQW1]|jgi:hypothetical protein|uniref:Uncharacterized protein n=1 Tax=Haloquadratum walsbyi J07HQW1 TaxID=1238424 RepID=U1PFK6_9EURY|nr:MAG: hypothetical protein J07HQW1_00904 [Haloquadratum walsbyi J07HQW1]